VGTTFSAVSVVQDGKPIIIPVGRERILPSVVGVAPDVRWLVGTAALNQWTLYPERTGRSIKRKMGTDETSAFGDEPKAYRPEQISTLILPQYRRKAPEFIHGDIRRTKVDNR
jgi:molecular chaperone DnaK